jgi:hypothetical protein
VSYKIWNPKTFCLSAEMKELLAPTESSDKGTTYQYSSIRENERRECEYVAEMFNACIDADNLLFPNSNYKKCFASYNTMYFCNKLERNSNADKELVISFFKLFQKF